MGPLTLFILRMYTLFMFAFFAYCLVTRPTSFRSNQGRGSERASRRPHSTVNARRLRPRPTALIDDPWARYTRESTDLLPDRGERVDR